MPRNRDEFRHRSGPGPAHYSARTDYGYTGYGYRGDLAYGDDGELGYGPEYYRGYTPQSDPLRHMHRPGKPARGFPVHGYHTYDLDYGRQAGGPTTDYSGSVGYDPAPNTWVPRGPYTPALEETRRREPYHPHYEAWHWSAAEPAWRYRRAARRYARVYEPRRPRH